MKGSKEICPICQSDKIIPNPNIITNEGLGIRVSVSKTKKKTGWLNSTAPAVSKIKANICGDCGNIQLIAKDAKRLWTAYQLSLKNS